MVVLTDDARDPRSIPTRQNMTAAMHWLVSGASSGDALFFHVSGLGVGATRSLLIPLHSTVDMEGKQELHREMKQTA